MRFFLSGPPTGSAGGSGGGTSARESSPSRAVEPPPRPVTTQEHQLLQVIAPLNALVGFSGVLADAGNDLSPELRQEYAVRVREAADTLQKMMSALVRAFDGTGLELGEDWVSSGTFRVAPKATEPEAESDSGASFPAVDARELAIQNGQLKSLQRFKDETTAMLVHDLKSPLSAMMMNLDFVLDDIPPEATAPDVRAALAESRASGAKLSRMIANLLDIARNDDGRLVPKRATIDVEALFVRVTDEHAAEAHARGVAITRGVDGSLRGLAIDADPDILGRVLSNLVENALRYADRSVGLEARRTTDAVVVTVTNDGRAVSQELRAFVFEKYGPAGNAHAISRGLGLYFCRVAVEAHGGTIELSDTPSPVTSFRIVLPQG